MDIKNLSSINCNNRNKYDKKFCNNMNPDKIDNFLKPYVEFPFGNANDNNSFFYKNTYELEHEDKRINGLSKEKCANYAIENNYKGFTFKGDKNKCFLYNSQNFDIKNDEILENYKIKTFIKTKNTIDIKKLEDQLDSSKYFNQTNNSKFLSNNLIKELDVNNENNCMDACVKDYEDCRSIAYLEQPLSCTFYKNTHMKSKDLNNNFDTYTVKKNMINENKKIINKLNSELDENKKDKYYYCNLNNNNCTLDYTVNDPNISSLQDSDKEDTENLIEIPKYSNNNVPIYNCSGIYSTNPFCTKEVTKDDYDKEENENIKNKYINYTDCIELKDNEYNEDNEDELFNQACKTKFGEEYVYNNDLFDLESKIDCENNGNNWKRAKCIMNFNNKFILENKDKIEHFTNSSNNPAFGQTFDYFLFVILIIIFALLTIILFRM